VRTLVPRIRAVATSLRQTVGILMDTQGPAIRTGDLPAKLELKPRDVFEFTVRGEKSEENYSVDVNYDGLIDDISVGDTVLVDNGVIHMKVLSKEGHRIRCEVLTEGTLGSRRHINLPGVRVNLPPLTEKDLEDVALGCELEVDFVALSFCREGNDVKVLRDELTARGSSARIVAKIEDQLAVRNLDEIIRMADVLMVARGDLGIECPMEDLPIIQRRIVKRCIRLGRPVIVATHMLESMITQPMPTRAEITDVANAVHEHADCVMLSGETTVGKYPLDCVAILEKVARRVEWEDTAPMPAPAYLRGDKFNLLSAAVHLADQIPGSALLTFTRRGFMAAGLAAMRPVHAPIFAMTNSVETLRQMRLLRAVEPVQLSLGSDPNDTIENAITLLVRSGRLRLGDKLIVATDILTHDRLVDSIQLRTVR
jgi:pyruvate kinase